MDSGTDLPVSCAVFRDNSFTFDLGCQTDRSNDLYITGTAAVVVADGPADLLLRRVRRAVEQDSYPAVLWYT